MSSLSEDCHVYGMHVGGVGLYIFIYDKSQIHLFYQMGSPLHPVYLSNLKRFHARAPSYS